MTNQEEKQPLGLTTTNEVSPTFGLTIKLDLRNIEQTKIRYEKHLANVSPSVHAEFGNVEPSDIWRVECAIEEKNQCQNCAGNCRKDEYPYSVPTIQVVNGNVKISHEICHYELDRRYRLSQLPLKYAGKTFADYDVTADNAETVKIARSYTKKKPAASLYCYGGAGTGKTFLSALIAQDFLRNGYSVEFGDVPSLLGRIKKTFGTSENSETILGKYKNCDLLILDDLGTGLITDWNADVLYQVVNDRYNANARTIVTSNYNLKDLVQRLKTGDTFVAKRIVSRLTEMCVECFFGEKDRRV